MTKHLEERLSEALDAAARTVPDNAVPPELFPAESGTAERRWVPVLAIGVAMAAVVAAVAIPVAISRNKSTPPASSLCPKPPAVTALNFEKRDYTDADYTELNKLPFGPAPKVPFMMARDGDLNGGYLEDLGVRVPIPAGSQVYSLGRVNCGWAAYRGSGKTDDLEAGGSDNLEIGVLGSDGKYRSFGAVAGGASLSPDGSQLAYVAAKEKGKASIVTVAVASGQRLAETPARIDAELVGWNSHGVWFMPDGEKNVVQVWRPGGKPVTVDTDDHQLTAYRGTDRMLLSDQSIPNTDDAAADLCVRVVTLDSADKLHTVLEKCGGTNASLSPDGRVLVAATLDTVKGYLVENGTQTRLHIPTTVLTADRESIWEDATHLLDSAGLGGDRRVTVRCDVVSGACDRIQDGPQEGAPVGPDLGYP